jgi:hypothetical protein
VTPHPLATLLEDAARGDFPEPDGAVEVLPAPPGRCMAVVGFTAHHVVAADVAPEWVSAQLPEDDLSAPMSASFLMAVGEGSVAGPAVWTSSSPRTEYRASRSSRKSRARSTRG